MDDLRIVRGNTFHTVSTVEARTYAGAIIPDFHLTDATDISVNIITDDLKMAAQFEVTGNDIDILWKDIPKGKYGIECLGIYQGVEWRFANRFVLTIVENNAAANIPPNCIIREDFYTIDATTLLMPVISGGGGVQSDWDESDTSSMAYIKHKPTNVSAFTNDAGYITSFTETDPTVPSWAKQSSKPTYTAQEVGALPNDTPIPDAQIQSDWNQSDDTAKDYIKNKPTIPAAQVQSDWNASSGMGAILNKPTIPTVPTNVSAFTNDAGYITPSSIANKANKITIVNYGTSSTTMTLSENIYYIWGEVASLTLTLGTPADASKLSEYMFEFQSGATPTTLSLPSSVKWVDTPTIEANKTYQVSIVNDIAIIVGV